MSKEWYKKIQSGVEEEGETIRVIVLRGGVAFRGSSFTPVK